MYIIIGLGNPSLRDQRTDNRSSHIDRSSFVLLLRLIRNVLSKWKNVLGAAMPHTRNRNRELGVWGHSQ